VQALGLTYLEFCDKTPFELSIELEGYNQRWEESWRHTRLIGTLLHNANVSKEDRVLPHEFLPLPADRELIEFEDLINGMKFAHSILKRDSDE
jgi:hypothetical protein